MRPIFTNHFFKNLKIIDLVMTSFLSVPLNLHLELTLSHQALHLLYRTEKRGGVYLQEDLYICYFSNSNGIWRIGTFLQY